MQTRLYFESFLLVLFAFCNPAHEHEKLEHGEIAGVYKPYVPPQGIFRITRFLGLSSSPHTDDSLVLNLDSSFTYTNCNRTDYGHWSLHRDTILFNCDSSWSINKKRMTYGGKAACPGNAILNRNRHWTMFIPLNGHTAEGDSVHVNLYFQKSR